MRSTGKSRTRPGRPTTGIRPGEKASEYRLFAVRLPDDTRASLDAIGRVVDRPIWQVIVDAVAAYLGDAESLSESDRRLAHALLKRSE
jgi:hypothetical protein